jgi:hypothetical protein
VRWLQARLYDTRSVIEVRMIQSKTSGQASDSKS